MLGPLHLSFKSPYAAIILTMISAEYWRLCGVDDNLLKAYIALSATPLLPSRHRVTPAMNIRLVRVGTHPHICGERPLTIAR